MGAPTREATRPDAATRTTEAVPTTVPTTVPTMLTPVLTPVPVPAPTPTRAPAPMPTTVPMSVLRRGDRGRVVLLDPTLPGPVARRLADLGFLPDADVRCVRRAPLGSPTIYRIGESELCLRRSLSDRILIEPVA